MESVLFLGQPSSVMSWFLNHLPIPLGTDHYSPHLLFADYCSPGAEVLSLDWRLHPGLSLHLPADVDQQARVWWGRALHCPQEVLLKSEQLLWGSPWYCCYQSWNIKTCKSYFSVWSSFPLPTPCCVSHTVWMAFHTLFLIHTWTCEIGTIILLTPYYRWGNWGLEKLRTYWRSPRTKIKLQM